MWAPVAHSLPPAAMAGRKRKHEETGEGESATGEEGDGGGGGEGEEGGVSSQADVTAPQSQLSVNDMLW